MVQDRVKEEGERKKSWISYLNDDGSLINAYVELIEANAFVIFKTNENIL